MKLLSYIIELFSEKKCYSCSQLWHFFCPQCLREMKLYEPYCFFCKQKSDNFSVHIDCQKYFPIRHIIVLTPYRNTWIKKLLRYAKYYKKYTAYEDIMLRNIDFFGKHIENKNSMFIPVPMHFLRKWKRGYNQSEKIADILWNMCQIPVKKNMITRKKNTQQQSHLGWDERRENLSGAFRLKNIANIPKNTTLYLVDDIITTGSTLLEIAKLLQKNGFQDIRAVCLASD